MGTNPQENPDGKKKRLKIFIYKSINIVDKHISYFFSVNSVGDKDSEIFCYKDNKVM